MNRKLILHASELATCAGAAPRCGSQMKEIGLIRDGAVLTEDERIVMAGTTDFAVTNDTRANEILTDLSTDADLYSALREAVHRNLYVIANSQEMNGISVSMKLVPVTTWYQALLTVTNIVFGILTLGSIVMLCMKLYKKEEK